MVEMPILKCHVIEPNMSETGETIASIPLKITAKAVFSQFTINPINDINFGAVNFGVSKRFFTIENDGQFDFKFTISKLMTSGSKNERKNRKYLSRDSSATSRKPAPNTRDNAQTLKINHGCFVLTPGYGTVQPGSALTIAVDCTVDQVG
jgi:hydrocephalus-inducing protein